MSKYASKNIKSFASKLIADHIDMYGFDSPFLHSESLREEDIRTFSRLLLWNSK